MYALVIGVRVKIRMLSHEDSGFQFWDGVYIRLYGQLPLLYTIMYRILSM